ncbi:MAG: hypothetical protein ACR5LD_05490 [Symbiopectobacterium sp.]
MAFHNHSTAQKALQFTQQQFGAGREIKVRVTAMDAEQRAAEGKVRA